MRESRTHPPGTHYYYDMETGVSTWVAPQQALQPEAAALATAAVAEEDAAVPPPIAASVAAAVMGEEEEEDPAGRQQQPAVKEEPAEAGHPPPPKDDRKRPREKEETGSGAAAADREPRHQAKKKKPREVRVLHILRKHRDSRRPTSWRTPGGVTINRDEAASELQSLHELLKEVEGEGDPAELKAAFEELARTESDCSSHKRGGDLGKFGRRKMHAAFEEASFALEVNELSDVIDTPSGVHLILRIE